MPHFVILDFGENRNLWLGSKERSQQIALYHQLLPVLGLNELDKKPSVH